MGSSHGEGRESIPSTSGKRVRFWAPNAYHKLLLTIQTYVRNRFPTSGNLSLNEETL
jgi:hypothetical protein